MRILFSLPLDPREHAAAGGHALAVARAWSCQGHHVTLIHAGSEARSNQEFVEIALGPRSGRIRRDFALGRIVATHVRRHQPDVLYHRFSKSSFLPPLFAATLRVPTVLEVNANLSSDLQARNMALPLRRLATISERFNYALADHIVVVSQGIAEAITQRFSLTRSSISVIPNGADLHIFRPLDPEECRRKLGLPDGISYAAFAGTFSRWQGLQTMVGAARLLRRRQAPINFLLVGDGPDMARLRKAISAHDLEPYFYLPGWCSQEETAIYLGASAVCLAPYTRAALVDGAESGGPGALMKGSPLKVYTYFASGRPMIASHFAEAGMLAEKYNAGLAIPPEDPEALAEAIMTILANPRQREQMAVAAREAAETHFSWDAVAAALARICGAAAGVETV